MHTEQVISDTFFQLNLIQVPQNFMNIFNVA